MLASLSWHGWNMQGNKQTIKLWLSIARCCGIHQSNSCYVHGISIKTNCPLVKHFNAWSLKRRPCYTLASWATTITGGEFLCVYWKSSDIIFSSPKTDTGMAKLAVPVPLPLGSHHNAMTIVVGQALLYFQLWWLDFLKIATQEMRESLEMYHDQTHHVL